KPKELPITNLPVSAGIVAAIIIGSLAIGSLCVGSIAYLLVTRGWRAQSHRMTATEKPEVGSSHHAGDNNIYEAMPTPVLLVSPLSDTRPTNATMLPPLPQLPPLESESHHYQSPPGSSLSPPSSSPQQHPLPLSPLPSPQDLLNPDPAPYCQLVPTPEGVPG
ncbi:Carcinoembryonic antigen-related cell adhesion molecule 19, partial [Camelus dromedarius]